jgi:hypothetical protein
MLYHSHMMIACKPIIIIIIVIITFQPPQGYK